MVKAKLSWKTERRALCDLTPMPKNPRTLSDKQRADLQKSIEKFDLVEPPVINTNGTLIAGHQRIKVLAHLHRPNYKIDVRVPSRKLTAAEVREYNIRSNRNTGDWDWELLASDCDFDDLIEYGFEEWQLQAKDRPENDPEKEWDGMPEFDQKDLTSWKQLTVHFAKKSDLEAFSKLIEQPLTEDTRSIWFPPAEIVRVAHKVYVEAAEGDK